MAATANLLDSCQIHRTSDFTVMSCYGCDVRRVPVVDVHKDNLGKVWPSLKHSLNAASFIAIDVELSGLGDRKGLKANDINDRYLVIAKTARSRSILSLGLSCFRLKREEVAAEEDFTYNVQTFNVTFLCNEDYVVEPASLRFLVDHGFDFNKQYAKGIPYYPGTKTQNGDGNPSARLLFWELMSSKKAIVIHNGLVDLVFLYHHFYTELPPKLSTFVADLCEMFPGGLYDTKFISEFQLRYPASYLEYVFRRLQVHNEMPTTGFKMVRLDFLHYDYGCVEYKDLSSKKVTHLSKADVCGTYSNHGWCPKGTRCTLLHDVSVIVQVDQFHSKSAKRKKNKRKFTEACGTPSEVDGEDSSHQSHSPNTHRAGYDAFMTGFSMAAFLTTLNPTTGTLLNLSTEQSPAREWANRICLAGKNQPLLIHKSHFTNTSAKHNNLQSIFKSNHTQI